MINCMKSEEELNLTLKLTLNMMHFNEVKKLEKKQDLLNITQFEIQKSFWQYLYHFMCLTMKREFR